LGRKKTQKLKASLTPEDKKSLRYECRPGILFGIGIFFIGAVAIYLAYVFMAEKATPHIYLYTFGSLALLIAVSIFISRQFISYYLKDLKNDEKDLIRYPIQKKEGKTDYEAGSASLSLTQEMKAWDHYILTINDSEHEVDKQMFDRANEGDEVTLHIAPVSGHLLKIELVK
jgi:hypothetical protein